MQRRIRICWPLAKSDHSASLPGLSFSPGIPFNAFGAGDSLVARSMRDASLRGRVGFLATPTTLVYATAGATWRHFEVTSVCNIRNASLACGGLSPAVIANSATKSGWTVELGAETMLLANWFAHRVPLLGFRSIFLHNRSARRRIDVTLRTHTATFGVAYKLVTGVTRSLPTDPCRFILSAGKQCAQLIPVFDISADGVNAWFRLIMRSKDCATRRHRTGKLIRSPRNYHQERTND
jgi:hypothetical protein